MKKCSIVNAHLFILSRDQGEESVAGRIYDVEQVFIAITVVRNRYLLRQFTNGVNKTVPASEGKMEGTI